MSEYWKSTPKYWCKHCKTFVRDTKLERTNHDATPKHQGNIQRFLRDIHRGHERDERDKQRAKDEVERLNSVVASSKLPASNEPPWKRRSTTAPANTGPRQATPAERERQLAQLAELGVAVPEEYRRKVAMAGDWQTLSERTVYDVKKDDDSKPDSLSIGVRKRQREGEEEEEEEAGETVVKNSWGSTVRAYPGASNDGDGDLDELLRGTQVMSRRNHDIPSIVDGEFVRPRLFESEGNMSTTNAQSGPGEPFIKREKSLDTSGLTPHIKQEDGSDVVFKKLLKRFYMGGFFRVPMHAILYLSFNLGNTAFQLRTTACIDVDDSWGRDKSSWALPVEVTLLAAGELIHILGLDSQASSVSRDLERKLHASSDFERRGSRHRSATPVHRRTVTSVAIGAVLLAITKWNEHSQNSVRTASHQ